MFPIRDDQPRFTTPFVNYFIIGLNIAVYLLIELSAKLLTIFTSMFLHADLFHIIGNLWFLWIFGDNIEDYVGHFPYLIFYLLCGVAAAVTDIALDPLSQMPTIGASGAIAGIM